MASAYYLTMGSKGKVRALAVVAYAAVIVVLPSAAGAATHEVAAAGNIFTGGLAFEPAQTTAKVGDTVRWTNTDYLVPHTATEDHRLFDLTGTYGQTPLSPPGFGPGDARERIFEAGTFAYFCEVHPVQMRGVVSVAPEVKRVKKQRLLVRWAAGPPAAGQVFDVERRVSGTWIRVRDGVSKPSAKFAGKTGKFRARLRSAADPALAAEFSPPAGP